MAEKFQSLKQSHIDFIMRQKMFFVATAPLDGRINLSPKGLDSFRVMDPNRVIWLNLTGSGNETAAHLTEDDRITVMFNAFEGNPLILRLYGTARAVHDDEGEWSSLMKNFPAYPGARQIIDMNVELVNSSCGAAVPLYDFKGDRDELLKWAEKKGETGIREYRALKNSTSLDGKKIR